MSHAGSSAQKKQLALSLERAASRRVADGAQAQGQGLPCHVLSVACGIVTVAFDVSSGGFTLPQVTCPIAESQYVILPIQAGDKGFVTSASARLGGVSGLGTGLAPLVTPSNLGGLVFVPIGNTAWTTPDANAVIVQGPNGAVIRTMDGESVVTIDEGKVKIVQGTTMVTIQGGNITAIAPNNIELDCPQSTINGSLQVNGASIFNGNVTMLGPSVTMTATLVTMTASVAITGSLTINGKDFTTHTHLPGSYHAGGTAITGDSGTIV